MVRRKQPDQISAPSIDIRVSVRAREVRFEESPVARVDFREELADRTAGDRPEVEAGSATERTNLPEEVQPGVVYRDVRVRWRAVATIAAHPRRQNHD